MNTKEKLKSEIEMLIKSKQEQLALLESFEELNQLSVPAVFQYQKQIDFDRLSHEQVIKVITAIGGTWKKEPAENGTVNYETTKNGVTFRCWQGAPPPNCKIVEYMEEIPAQEARMVTKRKLVCQ